MTVELRQRAIARSGQAFVLLMGAAIGVLADRTFFPATAVAEEVSMQSANTVHAFPAGAGTRALIIDPDGFAWTIDCADAGGPARRVSTGEITIDGRKTLTYHSFRTGRTYLMQDGELVSQPKQ